MNRLHAFVLLCLFTLNLWAKPVIIFDAGSSGTRLYVYEVEGQTAKSVHSFKVKPGYGMGAGEALAKVTSVNPPHFAA